jgi:glycosyltransferase involved in cell wall biosynthesis
MNSLYFAAHQIEPLNSGARLRNYKLAQQLAALSSVTFVEMRHAGEERHIPSDDSGLAGVVTLDKGYTYTASKLIRGLAGPTPVTVLNCWSPRAASHLVEVLKSRPFDSVQIAGTQLMAYLSVIRESPGSPSIVVDWHNIESELLWRYAITSGSWIKQAAARQTAKLLERVEVGLLETCGTHTVTSERERKNLLARCPGANIHVISNGVDVGYYSATKIAEFCRPAVQCDPRRTILFVGSMDYHANIDAVMWFARTAWPEIARNHPDLQFTIVGRDPAPEVRALASDRIRVTGTVDDVRAFYACAVAAVVPIRSCSGTRLKILEAMASGVPIVSTRLGAEGIEAEDNVHLLLADNGQELAAAVDRVVSSAETRVRLSRAAREMVCRVYDWSIIGKKLCRIHADLAESKMPNALRKVS